MYRRKFIALGTAAAPLAMWPVPTSAQQPRKLWRIGFLSGAARPTQLGSSAYAGFLRGMRELGYEESRDYVMEWRFAEGRFELFPELAAELVRGNVDIIVLASSSAIAAVQRATATIPIVMGISVDPVGQRYVASLARPGGNTTGLATSLEDTTPKQLQFLTMAVPSLTRVGVFVNPDAPAHFEILNILRAAVPPGRLSIVPAEMRNPLDIEGAFAKLMNERIGGVLLPSDSFSFRSASGSRNLP